MRYILFVSLLFSIIGCNMQEEIPDIVYKKGDFWPADFRSNLFSGKVVDGDKLYCNSVSVGRQNYFYCLNLTTGTVDWVSKVTDWASTAPIIKDSFIYYSSFVGGLYKFDKSGNILWESKTQGSFSEHTIHPVTNNLLVRTVENGILEYDYYTGELVHIYGTGRLGISLPAFDKTNMFIAGLGIDEKDTLRNLFKIDIARKQTLLRKNTGLGVDRLFIHDNRIYYVDERYRLNCINLYNGDSIWQSAQMVDGQTFMTRNPHIIFLDTSLLYYDSDQGALKEINLVNGNYLGTASYKENVSKGKLKKGLELYNVPNDKDSFSIQVNKQIPSDSELEGIDINIAKITGFKQ